MQAPPTIVTVDNQVHSEILKGLERTHGADTQLGSIVRELLMRREGTAALHEWSNIVYARYQNLAKIRNEITHVNQAADSLTRRLGNLNAVIDSSPPADDSAAIPQDVKDRIRREGEQAILQEVVAALHMNTDNTFPYILTNVLKTIRTMHENMERLANSEARLRERLDEAVNTITVIRQALNDTEHTGHEESAPAEPARP